MFISCWLNEELSLRLLRENLLLRSAVWRDDLMFLNV